jgi:hypothetical protein
MRKVRRAHAAQRFDDQRHRVAVPDHEDVRVRMPAENGYRETSRIVGVIGLDL